MKEVTRMCLRCIVVELRILLYILLLGSHWTDFHEILYTGIFRKSVQNFQVSLKFYNKNGYFT